MVHIYLIVLQGYEGQLLSDGIVKVGVWSFLYSEIRQPNPTQPKFTV
jgi:hypothetical protein